MKLSKYREKSNEYTAKASEIVRQLSLAGVAIIWLFKSSSQESDNSGQPLIDRYLIIPLISLSIALLVDLVQYIIGGQIWINFFRGKEKEYENNIDDPDIKAPDNLRIPIYICYYLKILLLVFSYIFLIIFLANKL